MYSSGRQNLAAALNDPNYRQLDLFTRTWGESFHPNAPLPHSNVPQVDRKDFRDYLRKTAEGRRVHSRVDRELNMTSLVSPGAGDVRPFPGEVSVMEQGNARWHNMYTRCRCMF